MAKYTMPDRLSGDGPVSIKIIPPGGNQDYDLLQLEVDACGETSKMVVSRYNAWRLFGMLSIFLELPLPLNVSKAINLGDIPKFVLSRHHPNMSFGDKVAAHIVDGIYKDELEERGFKVEQTDTSLIITPPKEKKDKGAK